MEEFFIKILDFLSIEFTVMMTAFLPVIELRGAIPVGISLGLSPIHSFVLSFIGSMIPVPFILFGARPIFSYLKKTKLFSNFIIKLTGSSMSKSGNIKKYGVWGLLIFVAIPVPGTGVWTGSLIAALMNMRFKWTFPTIFMGNLIAGLLIMGASSGLFRILS